MKKDKKKIFSGKDIFVILLSVIALTVLVLIIFKSNENAKKQQEELDKLSEGLTNLTVQYKEEEVSANLVVNEINQSGWVELYNKGNKSIDLSGYSIAVNGEDALVIAENTEMAAGDYYVIELEQKLQSETKQILTIWGVGEEVIVKVMIPDLQSGESYGCISDGSIEKSIMTASKGKSNEEGTIIATGKLEFSVPGGFYNENFQLTMVAPEGYSIYYTLDGSEPTADSMEYKNPISVVNNSGSDVIYAANPILNSTFVPSSIHKCMVVRAIAVNSQGQTVDEKTESYFIGLENASDYVGLSVISISTDPVNMFDYFEGIYVKGQTYENALARGENVNESANYLNGWSKTVNIEYFEPEKDKTFESKMELSILNDYSVHTAQKSMAMTSEAAGVTEGSSLHAYYNEESGRILLQTNRRDNSYKVREYLAAKLLSDREMGIAQLKPCIVFLDGEYWGVYMLRQNYDCEYIAQNYQVESDNVMLLSEGTAKEYFYQVSFSDFYSSVVNSDLSVQANYDEIKEQMDIQSFLDYFCANMYLANSDFGLEGWSVWRTKEVTGEGYNDGKWRWLMPKVDSSMANETASKLTTKSINSFLMPGVTESPFIMSLLDSEEFREQLFQTMQNMSENNFDEESVQEELDELSTMMKKPATSSYRRFFGYPADNFFEREMEKILDFFRDRPEYIMRYAEEVKKGELKGTVEIENVAGPENTAGETGES